MRTLITSYLLLLTCASAQVAQLRWDVQQDRPVAHDVYVWQGETVDLLPRLVQGISPVAVTNAPVEFRYREASLPTNTYRYVAASADTNSGVLVVRWTPDYDAGAAWYDYQIIVGSNAANPRCFGRIIMRPTIGWPASTNPPPPVTLYPTRDDLQSTSNALAAAVQAESSARASTDSALSNSFDSIAVSISTLKVALRWDSSSPNIWDVLEGGTNWVVYRNAAVSTNYTVTLSGDFETSTGENPSWTTHEFPFTSGDWRGSFVDFGDSYFIARVEHIPLYELWEGGEAFTGQYPLTLITGSGQGTATLYRSFIWATNEIFRVNIPSLTNIASVLQRLQANLSAVSNAAEQAQSDIEEANIVINNHTAYGTLGANAHLQTGDRTKIDSIPGLATTQALAIVIADKELHYDSYTNLIWRSVFSNGWHWLIAYTNTP